MAGNFPRQTGTVVIGENTGDSLMVVPESSETEMVDARRRLRKRWELASVLNFLNVFEPVIGCNLKKSAEEIETALIKPNKLLAELHISLLKGIPPVSKTLAASDSWVTALCKKLTMWWPWVAEGDFPLAAAKGEEISKYKELDPVVRLLILKALCEIRADQDDTVSHINDAMRNGTDLSSFRKNKIGGDGNGTSYWCDGNTIIGYRIYKEINQFEFKTKVKSKEVLPTINFKWETLATNLEEARKIVDEFSSSEVKSEAAVGKVVEADVIPLLEKLEKKKERALKQQQRQQILLNGFQNAGITRSCRNRGPVRYTFDEYDKAIDDAIRHTKIRKKTKERKHEERDGNRGEENSETISRGSQSTENELEVMQSSGNVDDDSDDDYDSKKGDDDISNSDEENSDIDKENCTRLISQEQNDRFSHRPKGSRCSERLAGIAGHVIPESSNHGAKNRLRQRPIRNTAIESATVPDSEDENSPQVWC